MWYKNEIDMTKDFSMTMYVNLGDKWDNGDGGGAVVRWDYIYYTRPPMPQKNSMKQ